MTTQELKNKIEKVLGNSIRCLLPSYWWKNLFHSVADRIDEAEATVSDMVVKSLKEFEAKHPDMASNTLVLTNDLHSVEARNNNIKMMRWATKMENSPAKAVGDALYIAVPIVDENVAYSLQTPLYGLGEKGVIFYDVRMPDGHKYNISFDILSGAATLQPASSGSGSVTFYVYDNLTEEQKQNNADAYLKVIEAEGAIDINIMVMLFIAKPNMVSVNDNGDLVLVAAGIDGGASKFIFTPEGDVTVETVEGEASRGEARSIKFPLDITAVMWGFYGSFSKYIYESKIKQSLINGMGSAVEQSYAEAVSEALQHNKEVYEELISMGENDFYYAYIDASKFSTILDGGEVKAQMVLCSINVTRTDSYKHCKIYPVASAGRSYRPPFEYLRLEDDGSIYINGYHSRKIQIPIEGTFSGYSKSVASNNIEFALLWSRLETISRDLSEITLEFIQKGSSSTSIIRLDKLATLTCAKMENNVFIGNFIDEEGVKEVRIPAVMPEAIEEMGDTTVTTLFQWTS